MTRARTIASGVDYITGIDAGEVLPHIIPNVLYPAVAGNDLNGTDIDTSHGSTYTYGTTHADGRMYYYTDIKGSKPIKDPRIGAHFGSQRHKFKSLQLLEQETATHGQSVFSIDGRKWARAVGDAHETIFDTNGNYIRFDGNQTTHFYEFVCYCSSLNMILECAPSNRHAEVSINGGSETSFDTAETVQNSPLKSRFVDAGTLFSVVTGQTLGIHTIKIRAEDGSDRVQIYGIEPVVQDTSNVNNIQIPSQNVVSYGKKFTVSGTPHYDPFNGMSGAKTLAQLGDYIDTATSLGMENWKAGTSNYYKPFNGGRVIKWVDSSGNIKTSVTMMPPNAQNISGTASNSFSDGEVQAGTNDHTITFDTTTLANATPLSEVAKTFHWREFGNGSANGGTGATYADASMLSGDDDIAYVMDDGLTSLVGKDVNYHATYGFSRESVNDGYYMTFIGTGITTDSYVGKKTWAQNLPYGTHIISVLTDSSNADQGLAKLDGVTIKSDFSSTSGQQVWQWMLGKNESGGLSFHQPKKPPIPEDAVVLADYMLMADHVKRTSADYGNLSKGVRLVSCSRDVFYDIPAVGGTNWAAAATNHVPTGMRFYMSSTSAAGNIKMKLPAFGTSMEIQSWVHGMNNFYVNGTSVDETDVNSSDNALDFITQDTASTLGMNTFEVRNGATNDGNIQCWFIHTPIHTSSHYQTFETPYLHELVGGDRNMEQHNLVVTPDGKTWDDVTRNTSYIENASVGATGGPDNNNSTSAIVLTEWRGNDPPDSATKYLFNKDWAIAYDRMICLKDGYYMIHYNLKDIHQYETYYYRNSTNMGGISANSNSITHPPALYFERGDIFRLEGAWDGSDFYTYFQITRL